MTEAASIDEITASPVTAEEIGRLVDGEVLAIFAAAVSEGRARNWAEFTALARVDLPKQLAELGVQRREHGNNDREMVRRCQDALTAALRDRGRHRSKANILSDAESMAMVWRKRRRHARNRVRSAWPGAWLVTSDRTVSPAMQPLVPDDEWPYTLTLAQLTLLLTRCQEVPSIRDLAEAAAALAAYEASESIACRYPPIVAMELARAIAGGKDGREYDVRVAQTMTLEAALAETELRDPAIVTSRVLGARQRRHDEAMTFHRERLTESRRRAEEEAKRAHEAAAVQRGASAALLADLDQERRERERLARVHTEAEERRQAEAARAGRTRVRDGILVFQALIAVIGFFTYGPLLITALVSVPLFWERSRSWVRDGDAGLRGLIAAGVAVLPDSVALIVWLWPHLQ